MQVQALKALEQEVAVHGAVVRKAVHHVEAHAAAVHEAEALKGVQAEDKRQYQPVI